MHHESYNVQSTSGKALAGRDATPPKRKYLVIQNDSDTVVYLCFGDAARANEGIRLAAAGAAGSSIEFTDPDNCPQEDIYAIHGSSGSKKILISFGL
ncbi:MAG: hypothetical protein M1445_08465 [Bacteroidetes bacterium]|nr:hypothetical protein [Bacteroidota bacterium]